MTQRLFYIISSNTVAILLECLNNSLWCNQSSGWVSGIRTGIQGEELWSFNRDFPKYFENFIGLGFSLRSTHLASADAVATNRLSAWLLRREQVSKKICVVNVPDTATVGSDLCYYDASDLKWNWTLWPNRRKPSQKWLPNFALLFWFFPTLCSSFSGSAYITSHSTSLKLNKKGRGIPHNKELPWSLSE